MMNNIPLRLVLFDGICNLCNGAVQFIINHDPAAQFSFAPLQSAAGQAVLKKHDLPLSEFNSFIYVREGRVYQRSTAALMVLRDLGGFLQVAYIFMIIPRSIRDYVYDIIARFRYQWFGRREACMIPSPDLNKRFL